MTLTMLAVTVLAAEPNNTGPDFGKASPVGLLVLVVLLIATVFLGFSLNRHLRKVPASFADENPAATEVTPEPTDAAEPADPAQDKGDQPAG